MMASMLGNMFAQSQPQADPFAQIKGSMQMLSKSLSGKPEDVIPVMIRRMGIPESLLKQYGAQATEMLRRMGMSR